MNNDSVDIWTGEVNKVVELEDYKQVKEIIYLENIYSDNEDLLFDVPIILHLYEKVFHIN